MPFFFELRSKYLLFEGEEKKKLSNLSVKSKLDVVIESRRVQKLIKKYHEKEN